MLLTEQIIYFYSGYYVDSKDLEARLVHVIFAFRFNVQRAPDARMSGIAAASSLRFSELRRLSFEPSIRHVGPTRPQGCTI